MKDSYAVYIKKKVQKNLNKLPKDTQELFWLLIEEIELKGPIRSDWNNFSKLGKNKYHCHLSYHWVACWQELENKFEIEVYYAGSRENAPY
ncbi:MAG: hypothetical protein KBA66_16260 [Leptospiraceae bacterium]|nr:hypothetical protein [Leptospiraceae bacterium]